MENKSYSAAKVSGGHFLVASQRIQGSDQLIKRKAPVVYTYKIVIAGVNHCVCRYIESEHEASRMA